MWSEGTASAPRVVGTELRLVMAVSEVSSKEPTSPLVLMATKALQPVIKAISST